MSQPQRTIGYLAQVACTWEVLARKAGNVCPGREFPDLTVNDFLKSAAAIRPVLDQAPQQPLGVTILRCIEETRKVVNTNTNLGIVLLLAPLASVPLDEPLYPAIADLLGRTTVVDTRHVYTAIRLANPGGMGEVNDQDIRGEPTLPLFEVMALAKDRDQVAREYALAFLDTRMFGLFGLPGNPVGFHSIEHLVVEFQLDLLRSKPDSLIARKRGRREAEIVQNCASKFANDGEFKSETSRQAYLEFDTFLRADNHARNPGTTADLIAAALFVALREERIPLSMPFV
jgi:triphosphoribosyl-dephospho-CoA synthase